MVHCESIALHICCEFMYTGEGDVAPSLSFLCIWNVRVYCLAGCVYSGWEQGDGYDIVQFSVNTSCAICRICECVVKTDVLSRKGAVLSWSRCSDVARLYWSVDGETPAISAVT
jgi:hypothetical protein